MVHWRNVNIKGDIMTTIEKEIEELKELASCANITLEEVLNNDKTMKTVKKELETIILENHKYNIYYSESEKAWRTYLPDDTKASKRKPVKRSSKENLEKLIIDYYVEKQQKESRDNILLKELFHEWMLFRRDETSAKASTIRKDMIEWNKFYKDSSLADMKVQSIQPIVLIKFFRKLTKDRTYTRKRITGARSILSGMFAYAIEEEIITHNPILDVDFNKFSYKPVENQSDNVFTKEDATKLLKYLRNVNEPYSLAIQLSFCLFIRIGETKAIRWDNVDLENRTIYLNCQALQEPALNDDLSFSKKKTVVENYIKGYTSKGFRKEYLTDEAISILEKAKEINPDGEFVFMPFGKLMSTDMFNKRLKRYCKAVGIPYHSSHKIRFYSASTAFDGHNLATISKMMGHSQVATTMHYLRDVIQDDALEETFKNLGCQ